MPLACIDNLEGKVIDTAIANGDFKLEPGGQIYTSEEMAEVLSGDAADDPAA